MMKKVMCMFLAVVLCAGSLTHISHAQENELQTAGAEEKEWKLCGINFDKQSPQPASESIVISADVENEQEDLQYKFVWMKDNWKEWAVIQEFSEKSDVEWKPNASGEYHLYVDVKDVDGNTESVNKSYSIIKNQWSYQGILPNVSDIKRQEAITISPKVSGNAQGLQYKFVWMKDNWAKWDVIQTFSSENQAVFVPEELGKYTIYVDIKDQEGNVTSKNISYNVRNCIWNYDAVAANVPSPQEINLNSVAISAITSGDTDGLQYKFVWMKDNWKTWGVIQNFSEENVVEWHPRETGKYTIYVDVRDLDEKTLTKSLAYEITKPQWNYERVETDPVNNQSKFRDVNIKAVASGNTDGLQYKFVWMRDNWKAWGIVQEFSEKNEAVWTTPGKTGPYKLYVDIKDAEGEIRTKELTYYVSSQIWEPEKLEINNDVKEQVYTHIPITVNVSGESQDLQYKFSWKKGKESGTIQEFAPESKTEEWYPKESGIYTITAEIKDSDGVKKYIEKEYEVLAASWKLEKLNLEGSADRFIGDKVKVTAETSGNTEGLQYKFVCRRGNDWSDWEVVQEFSENNSIDIPLAKAVDYNIYVDIKDQRGVTFDAHIVTVHSHRYTDAKASAAVITKGQSVKLYPDITGESGELQYKYVWMKDNWKEWGVIKDFSSASNLMWTPDKTGNYTIYIDVNANGIVQSKSVNIGVYNYQNPLQYLQIRHVQKKLSGGGYDLNSGYMGLKVLYTQRKLGLNRSRAIMDSVTMQAVRNFQAGKKLPVTGVVNLETWKAMGFTEEQWYNLGTYTSKLKTGPESTRKECIEAMISTAYEYLGTEYVIGAAGAPGTGADCSGLVMQALYSAGIDPAPVDPVRHSHPGYEYESRNLWNLPMKKVTYAERQRGDLIFYSNSSGVIIHVAIYLGNDQVIEEWPTKAVVWPIKNSSRSIIKGVMRPFV